MKITNRQVVEMMNTLEETKKKVLPRKLSFAIGRNLEKMASIYKPYIQELRKLEEEYVVMDKNGNPAVDAHDRIIYTDRRAYQEGLEELQEIENDFEMHTISEELLEQCEKEEKYDDLTAAEQIALMRMLKE